jgi:hypothetical protein
VEREGSHGVESEGSHGVERARCEKAADGPRVRTWRTSAVDEEKMKPKSVSMSTATTDFLSKHMLCMAARHSRGRARR